MPNPPGLLDSGDVRRLARSLGITAFYQFPGSFFPGPGPTTDADFIAGENKGVGSFKVGNLVARHPSGTGFILADSSSVGKAGVGIATLGVAVGLSETVQTGGAFTLADWTQITGFVSLSPLANYFLTNISGQISTSPMNGSPVDLQFIGLAISPTTLLIRPDNPIIL